MLRVGLTGGLASGKSFVGRALADLGCLLIQADELGHQVLEPGGEAYDGVIREFGPEIVRADGTIDYQPAAAQAGEYIALKALMDCLVALSACPFDQEIDGRRPNHPTCSPLRLEFFAE